MECFGQGVSFSFGRPPDEYCSTQAAMQPQVQRAPQKMIGSTSGSLRGTTEPCYWSAAALSGRKTKRLEAIHGTSRAGPGSRSEVGAEALSGHAAQPGLSLERRPPVSRAFVTSHRAPPAIRGVAGAHTNRENDWGSFSERCR